MDFSKSTLRYNPEDQHRNFHHRQNKKSYVDLYKVYHPKRSRTTIIYYSTKIKSEAIPPTYTKPSNLPRDAGFNVNLVARPLLTPLVQKLCGCEHNRTCVHLEHHFASKSFISVREAFSNAHSGKEVPNTTTI
jgi:hypothetical protein